MNPTKESALFKRVTKKRPGREHSSTTRRNAYASSEKPKSSWRKELPKDKLWLLAIADLEKANQEATAMTMKFK